MNIKTLFSFAGSVIFLLLFNANSFAAPGPCQGPNKNNPECLDPPPPPPPAAIVNSASVDWQNQNITVRGENLDSATAFSLGGVVLNAADLTLNPNEINIPFNVDVATAVTSKGNYQLNIDGTDMLSLFIKSQIIDTEATGCPCASDWSTLVGGLPPAPNCFEITSPDRADIAGIILTEPLDSSVYPQYPIGAAFIPSNPIDSVCRLDRADAEDLLTELVNFRINANQQIACAELLETTYCATITPLP